MAKALKYFAYYGELPTTPSGTPRQYKLEFWFEGFTGTATEVKMGGNGFKVSELSNDDEIQGLKEEKYSIQLIAPAGSGLSADDFYIRNEEEVVIKFFADNVLIKTGYLTGETLSEEYHDATKHINLEAISGLRRLKDKDYVDANGKAFRGTTTIAEKINRCLQATGLGLPVRMSHHLHAIPTDLNNNEGFIVRYEDLHHKGETFYDVLDKIAKTMNLSIFQEDGYWYVLHVFSKVVGTRGYQQFTPAGDFDGNGVLTLTRNALHKSTVQPKGGTFIYEPALKKVTVNWKLGKYKNYLLNDIFEDWDGTNFASWDVFNASRPGTITRTGLGLSNQPFRAKITGVNTNPFQTLGLAQTYLIATRPDLLFEEKLTKQVVFSASAWARDVKEIYARVSVGFKISGTGGRTIRYYLADDNTWSMKNDTFLKVSTVDPNGKSKNSVFQFDINAPRLDELKLVDVAAGVTVGIINIDQVSITVNLLGGQGATKVPYENVADPYVEFSNIGLQLIDVSTNLNITELRYEAINNANATRKVEIQAAFGDFVDASQNSALQFFGEEKTTYWRSDEDLAERELLIYTARDILRSRASVRKVWEGVLWGDIKRSDLVTLAEGGAKYAFVNYEYDYTKGMASVRMVKLNDDNPNVTLKKYAILRDGTEIEMDIQGFDMPELVNPFMIPSSVPFSILDNLFNLTNIVTVDYGFLNLQSLDNLFTGLKVVEGETEIRNFELTSTGLKSVTAGKTFSLDSSALTAEANLKIADTLTSTPETLATREWAANGLETKYLQLDTTYTNGNFPGRLSWDSDHDLMFLGLENDYTAKVPQDSVWSCIAGEAITKGQLVYASGTSGNSGKIVASKFIANGTIPSRFVIGVATRTVAQGDTFHALRAGVLRGLDTSAYTQGQDLWASSTVAGGFQTTAPFAPNPKISFAFVITSHANVGEVAIRVAPSVSLGLIDDVQVISPTNGQVLTYDGNKWINSTSVNILTDKQFTDVASGLRQIRSIDYYESRMDFGFDKVLDVPYLYYDKNNIRYVNYMNGDGVFVHVDSSGNQREYLRVGDIASEVPNLQQVSEGGRSSSVRLQWNGIDYAVGTPTLQDVSQQGSNSSIRLKFNGQDYATLQDLIGITAQPTPNLQQVSQQGANSTIRLQFNGVNYATVNDINTGGTIPTLSTVLTAGNNTGTQRINFNNFAEMFAVVNVSYGSGVFLGTESVSNTCHIRLQGSTFELVGLQGAVVDSVSGSSIGALYLQSGGNKPIRMNGIDYAFGQTPTLTAGAKYVFQWDGSKFIIVNA